MPRLKKKYEKCKIDNCVNNTIAKGYCQRHYLQISRHGQTIVTENDVIRFEHSETLCFILLYDLRYRLKAKAIIDIEDYDKAKNYTWSLDVNGYVVSVKKKKHFKLHRIIINAPFDKGVDHIDNDPLNNRKNNLRLCNQSQNMSNRRAQKNSKTGIKGIQFVKGSWIAQVNHKGKTIHLGSFRIKRDAVVTYNKKIKEIFGDFAKINNVPKLVLKKGVIK